MGSIIGKESVAEPPFKVLLSVTENVKTPYEIREYGKRFVAQIEYNSSSNSTNSNDDTGTPFRALAKYIGVFGEAQNHGTQSMDMTAPVAMTTQTQPTSSSGGDSGGGTKIAMTAPVAMTQQQQQSGTKIAMTAPVAMTQTDNDNSKTTKKVMKFFLPAEYDDMSKIPVPTNPNVTIQMIPPEVGAVHRYSGWYSDKINKGHALDLASQLRSDMMIETDNDKDDEKHQGMFTDDDETIKSTYQFWGYNPPFCLPQFRRNEVWIPLTTEQVEQLQKKYKQ